MSKLLLVISLIVVGISNGNADDNNLFIQDYSQSTNQAAPPLLVKPKVEPPPQRIQEPVIHNDTDESNSQFINYNYWDLGSEEHLVGEESAEIKTSEVKTPDEVPRPTPRPKQRPTPAPKPKVEAKKPKPVVKPETPAKATPRPAGGLRCDKPSGIAAACSQHGIREGLESVISDCNTVRCYLKLFHYETSCRPFLTHQAIVTAYGMCSIEKDKNLRKRFGADCSNISNVDGQIKCCRKMMKTVGRRYFEPVKVGRLSKCE